MYMKILVVFGGGAYQDMHGVLRRIPTKLPEQASVSYHRSNTTLASES